MHRVHLRLVEPTPPDRSAKVIALRSRRRARLEQRDPTRRPTRPAA